LAVTNLAEKKHTAEEARGRLKLLREEVEVEIATAKNALEAERARSARAIAMIPVESLRAEVGVSQPRLEQTLVVAPIKGRILKLLRRAGEHTGASPVLQMGDTQAMVVIAEVPQTDVHLVRPGQKVKVSSPALMTPIDGEVETIGALIYRNNVF